MLPIVALAKKNWFYVVILISIFLIYYQGKIAGKSSLEAQQALIALNQSKDSLAKLKDSLANARKPIINEIAKIDTVWRIRTLVLAKVDSSWHTADSIIALVPSSDSACHTAYNNLKSGCELLKTQVKNDSIVINSADSVLKVTNSRLFGYQNTVSGLQSQLAIIKKPYVCHILFISCPSRTISFFIGILGVEAIRIGVGKP